MNDFLIDFGTVQDTNVSVEERVPANWNMEVDGDNITAVNSVTSKQFKGTVADFNMTYFSEHGDTTDQVVE